MHDSTAAHVTEGELAGYIDNDLGDAERRRVEAHLDACSQCREELVAVRRVAETLQPGANSARRPWVPAAVGVALAASLAAVVLLPRLRAPVPGLGGGLVRGQATDGVAEGRARIEAVAPPPGATVPASPVRFAWRPANADVYRLTLLSDSGEPVWSTETTDTTVMLSAAVTLAPGAYFWRVDAITDGITATTGVRRLVITH